MRKQVMLYLAISTAAAVVSVAAGAYGHGVWVLLGAFSGAVLGASWGWYLTDYGKRPEGVVCPYCWSTRIVQGAFHTYRCAVCQKGFSPDKRAVKQAESPVSRPNGEPGVVPTRFGSVPVQRRLGQRLECCCGVVFSELSMEGDWLLHVSANPGHKVKELISTQISTFPCG